MMGAVFQMFDHGTITAMLFIIVGVIYDRAHTRDLNSFGGLALTMPKYHRHYDRCILCSARFAGV